MDRRNFFKILSTASAGVLATDCGRKPESLIPLLVPEHEIVPGHEQWHPAVCTECSAGCGTIVRVMEAERIVQRAGERVRERIAAIKKIEGNPLDPISGGRLCARGQAAVQSLYHPDRLQGPMERAGDRGQARFRPIPWDEAIAKAAEKIAKAKDGIVFLTGPNAGLRQVAIQRFQEAIGAPPPVVCSLADFATEREAAARVFGWQGLPVYDLARAHTVLGVGADFLGGWASPVYYARQFGHFRQGRREVRGYLMQAESRLSLTAAAADRWLPLQPGDEARFLGALGRHLLDAGRGRELPKSVADAFHAAADDERAREVASQLRESVAPLVIAGGNSLDAVAASHYINLMLGNVGQPGGVLPPPRISVPVPSRDREGAVSALSKARLVLIDGANPEYILPNSLARAESVISFATFLDDSAAWADLLLPDHHALESEMAVVPAVSPQPAIAVATPFVQPLYNTRPVEQTLAALASKLDAPYRQVTAKEIVGDSKYEEATRNGGLWLDAEKVGQALPPANPVNLKFPPPAFPGDDQQYPLHFQPYLSLQFHDGSGANLPWLQELPDPSSSSIWGLPVEIDPKTAAAARIANGDIVRIESPHGRLEAPAYVHPGAIPGVVSMPIGDGHKHYTRYASGRGANPLTLGATRVRLTRVASAKDWIQFSAQDREERRPHRSS